MTLDLFGIIFYHAATWKVTMLEAGCSHRAWLKIETTLFLTATSTAGR